MHYMALAGEQPMLVLLPLWQVDGFTSVQFIASPTTMSNAETLADVIRKVQPSIGCKCFQL